MDSCLGIVFPHGGWQVAALVIGLQIGFATLGTLIGFGIFILLKEI